jgi:predicted outer membrane repeat protein
VKTTLPHRTRSRIFNIALFLILLLTTFLPARQTAQAAPEAGAVWYDGSIQYSTITNCLSIIQGSPYQEYGAGAYVGFLADPDNALPFPNTVYYMHIVVAGLGNSCSGMRTYIDLGLPANTSLAIDATNKVYCLYDGAQIPANECTQVPLASSLNPGMYNFPSVDSAHAYLWPIPQGHFLELQIPVRSSTTLTNSALLGRVWMQDGNSNPWLQPQQGVYVFNNTPTILYPSPSTTSIQSTTAHSEAFLYTHGLGGTGYFDLGTSSGYGLIHEAVSITAGGNAFKAWDDWGPPTLTPDTIYHWRFTFTPSSGSPMVGVDQTFRTLPSGIAVVGSGATGSCSEGAFNTALATGFPISFSCGPLPTTITLTNPKSIPGTISIDGGNLVTLATSGASNHFNVQGGAHLSLTRITLSNGSTNTCGGAIHVLASGQLSLDKTSFSGNTTTNKGGAVCIESGASADIHFSTFNNNHSSGGGAVFNGGTMVLDYSSFTSNSSTIHGGAIQNYGSGTISDTSFNLNSAPTNGGAIDAGGTLSVARGAFTNNTSGIRGGGINVYGGNLTVIESSFVTNHSSGYGGGIANDASTVAIQTSEFSGNTAVSVGGGLRSNGTTSVTNSTFSGNNAGTTGGAIDNSDTSGPPDTLALVNTTLVSNTAGTSGGNLYLGSISSANVTLKNTLVASGAPNNCDKSVTSLGHNLENTNTCGLASAGDLANTLPHLGPLQNSGGFSRTYPLFLSSPAIDGGTNTGCPGIDQRGFDRPFDGNFDGSAVCDIGAFESGFPKAYLPLIRR